jgi:hypothetical protein
MATILEIATVVAGFVNRIFTFLKDNKPELAEGTLAALRSLPDPPVCLSNLLGNLLWQS